MAVIDDNLAGMRSRVRSWLHETSSSTSFWSNDFIDKMLNVSYRRRCGELVMAYEGYFTNVGTANLVADQERYAWPPGFERCLRMELVRSDGIRVPIDRYERHYKANDPNAGAGVDTYLPTWRVISGGFVLEPPPGESVTDGLRIEYTQLPALMQNDNDSMHVDFPRSFDELIILDAAVACLDSENLLETGAVRSALRMRAEIEQDFRRFIENRAIGQNKIAPFIPHYPDA